VQKEILADSPKTFSIMGLPVHLLPDYTSWLVSRIRQGVGCQVVTLNAEMSMQAEKNPRLAHLIRQADLVIPDGAGVVLFLKLQGKKTQRCPGIELAEALLRELGQSPSLGSVFFFGGAPGIAERAADFWKQQLPTLAIAGTQNGFLTSDSEQRLKQSLTELHPQVILVGMGVPRQEFWIAEHRHLCPGAVWIGVGGSFDIWAGEKERAPEWLRNNHLEWVYRLYKEPWRWRRMLALPQFAWRSLIYQVTGRSALESQG
jgi:N-acetylglucosaminyldiphosphoundecaprenol N-acetyl-beta-D-mannosaminyltransferase